MAEEISKQLSSMQVSALARRALMAWLLLLLPMALIDVEYALLPARLPLLRDWSGVPQLMAAKSSFTAFRIPLMGMLLAAMVTLMWVHAWRDPQPRRRALTTRFWFILLYVAALKGMFEGLQFVADVAGAQYAQFARWCWLATVVVVVIGVVFALFFARQIFAPARLDKSGHDAARASRQVLARGFRPLSVWMKLALSGLLVVYAALALSPVLLTQV